MSKFRKVVVKVDGQIIKEVGGLSKYAAKRKQELFRGQYNERCTIEIKEDTDARVASR